MKQKVANQAFLKNVSLTNTSFETCCFSDLSKQQQQVLLGLQGTDGGDVGHGAGDVGHDDGHVGHDDGQVGHDRW